jgi:hypothetical protein
MNKKLILLTCGIYLLLAGLIYIGIQVFKENPIQATLYPKHIFLNDPIFFTDSTKNAHSVVWEFGNGDTYIKPKGQYVFKEPGQYKVRLTINDNAHQTFLVDVAPAIKQHKIDSTVKIFAESYGITGQKIHFKAMGKNIDWCEWHFNGMGKIDSRALESFYSYNKPGVYQVYLVTNLNFNKPQKHTITIEPQYKITENIVIPPKEKAGGGAKAEKEDEFFTVMKEIANGNDFNKNYNFLLKKYLCGNSKTPVIINGGKTIDFYSYCQGLQINTNAQIKSAVLEMNAKTNCVTKINIAN